MTDTTSVDRRTDPSFQAFLLLRTVFTIAPIAFGLDKFTNILTNGRLSRSVDQRHSPGVLIRQ